MTLPTVRVYDWNTEKVTTIPVSELAPGMLRIRLADRPDLGDVFVDRQQINMAKSELRHPPFPEKFREFFRQLSEDLADVYPKTPEEWEDGFRCDIHPDQEMEIWYDLADAFRHFAGGKSRGVRQDIFALLLAYYNNGPDAALLTVSLKTLTRRPAEEIIAEMRKKKRL